MADIRIKDLPLATGGTAPTGTDAIAIDGLTTRKTTIATLGDVAVPVASQSEAEAGVNASKRMTPLTTKQSIASEVGDTIASAAQGVLANTALQPGEAATPAQGAKADAALPRNEYAFFDTESLFQAANIPVSVSSLHTNGYYTPGDGGGHVKRRIATPAPVEAWHKQSADGAWWLLSESIITPQMFGARSDDAFDSGPAIQSAYDMGVTVSSVKCVRHIGDYRSAIALRPLRRRNVTSNNYNCPFDLDFVRCDMYFTGTGHANDTAWKITTPLPPGSMQSARYGNISGRFRVMNEGDWGYGIVFDGGNYWTNSGTIEAGLSGPLKFFTKTGIIFRRYDDDGVANGGFWNSWGTVRAWGGEVPMEIGETSNSLSFDHVFVGHGTKGMLNLDGSRISIAHLAIEIGGETTVEYGVRNRGQNNFIRGEIERSTGSGVVPTNFKAIIYCTDVGITATGDEAPPSIRGELGFWAANNLQPYFLKEGASAIDITWHRRSGSTPRWERFSDPAAREDNVALVKSATRTSVDLASGTIGIGVYGAIEVLVNGLFRKSIDPRRIAVTNNKSISVDVNVILQTVAGVNRSLGTISIASGASRVITEEELIAPLQDGDVVNTVAIQARAASSVTGTVNVVTSAYLW